MWSTFKSMPLLPKAVIICLILALVYKVSGAAGSSSNSRSPHFTPVSDERRGDSEDQDDQQPRRPSGDSNLAQFQAQQMQIQSQVQRCEAQMTEATNRQAMAAMNGQMYNQRPACEQAMPQLIAQEAYVETEIQRINDPSDHRSLREITRIAPPTPSGDSVGYRPANDGTDAVDRYDRQVVRENSRYTDENGEQHELPTRNTYYRDRSSGQIIGTDQSNPPNDGRDYEQFQNGEPQ